MLSNSWIILAYNKKYPFSNIYGVICKYALVSKPFPSAVSYVFLSQSKLVVFSPVWLCGFCRLAIHYPSTNATR